MDSARSLSSIIGGVGRVHRLHAYSVDLPMTLSSVGRICWIGAGCVGGGPTMAVIADRCPDLQVTVADLNEQRFAHWYRSFYAV